MAFGDGRDYAAAFVNIDLPAVGNWAERRHLAYSGYTDLAGQEPIGELVRECVEKVNQDLAMDPGLGGSQIRRFLVLHKELDRTTESSRAPERCGAASLPRNTPI